MKGPRQREASQPATDPNLRPPSRERVKIDLKSYEGKAYICIPLTNPKLTVFYLLAALN